MKENLYLFPLFLTFVKYHSIVRVENYTYTFQTNVLGTHGTCCTFVLGKTQTAFLEKILEKCHINTFLKKETYHIYQCMYFYLQKTKNQTNMNFCKSSIVVIPILLITFFNLLLALFLFIPAKFTETT